MSMPATRHRFTLEAWHRMIEAGVFQDDVRVELLDGEIFEMTPIYPPHQSVVDRLARLLITRLGTRAIVRIQGPVPARPRSEPQPDLAILRERPDFYRTAHPEAHEVLLIIEVADTTLERDHAKLRLYATAGMREVWIVDLAGDRVEVHRDPEAAAYRTAAIVRRGASIVCPEFRDVVLTVDDILG
jgi:Uma2 family endonuclease